MARAEQSTVPLERVCHELEAARRMHGDQVTFDATWFGDLINMLVAATPFDEGICDQDRIMICRSAVSKAARAGPLQKDRVLAAIGRERAAFVQRPQKTFTLLTSISLRQHNPMSPISHRGTRLAFHRRPPDKYSLAHLSKEDRLLTEASARTGLVVTASLRARSEAEAYEHSSAAIDFLRGIWNFDLNRGTWRQTTSDENRPLNRILPGPVHTLHKSDGSAAVNYNWYEPFYRPSMVAHLTVDNWRQVEKTVRVVRLAVRRGAFGLNLQEGIIRYCRALDNRDPTKAFVKLWSVLEFLTSTLNDEYGLMIKRTANVYPDPVLHRQVLELLRTRRNRSVHAGQEWGEAREDLVRLHVFVADILRFAIQGAWVFTSFEEMGAFLSLSKDRKRLKREIAMRAEALRFHRPRAGKRATSQP